MPCQRMLVSYIRWTALLLWCHDHAANCDCVFGRIASGKSLLIFYALLWDWRSCFSSALQAMISIFHRSVCLLLCNIADCWLRNLKTKITKAISFVARQWSFDYWELRQLQSCSCLYFSLIESKGQVGGHDLLILPSKLTLWIFFLSWLLVARYNIPGWSAGLTFPILYWALGFLGLSLPFLSQELEKPKNGLQGCCLISWFPLSMNLSVDGIWDKRSQPVSPSVSWLFHSLC